MADLQSLPKYSSATLATVSLDMAWSLLSPSLAKVEINSRWDAATSTVSTDVANVLRYLLVVMSKVDRSDEELRFDTLHTR